MSTLRLTTISNQTGSASVPSDTVINGSAKAWVNFNGTGTVAIRASFNVSSITDRGTGAYTVNLSTAMADTNGALVGSGGRYSNGFLLPVQGPQIQMSTTSNILAECGSNSTDLNDWQDVYVAVFR